MGNLAFSPGSGTPQDGERMKIGAGATAAGSGAAAALTMAPPAAPMAPPTSIDGALALFVASGHRRHSSQ
jgi:hypothetical protein